MGFFEKLGVLCDKLVSLKEVLNIDPSTSTMLMVVGAISSVINQLAKDNKEAQAGIEKQLRDLNTKTSDILVYVSRQGEAYFKTGVSYLEDIENFSSKKERREGLIQARGEFMHATSIEEGLMQALAWLFVGACNDLLNQKKVATSQYKKSYEIAFQNEVLQSLIELPDIKIVPRNSQPTKLHLENSKNEEAAYQKKMLEADRVIQFLELVLRRLLIPRGVYGQLELLKIGQARRMLEMRKFFRGGPF